MSPQDKHLSELSANGSPMMHGIGHELCKDPEIPVNIDTPRTQGQMFFNCVTIHLIKVKLVLTASNIRK